MALATAKKAGRNPRELARQLADHLNADLPPHVTAVEIAGPGLRQLPAGRHLAARRARRRRRRRASTATPGTTIGAGTQGQRRVRERQPHRSAPRRPRPRRGLRRLAGPAARAVRLRRSPGSTTSTTAARRCRTSSASLRGPQEAARPCPRAATTASTSIEWAAEMPDDVDSARVGRGPGHRGPPRGARRAWTSHFDSGSASGRWSSAAPSRRPSPTSASTDMVYDDDGAVWLRTTDFGDDKDRVLDQDRRRVHLPAARHRLPPRQVRPGLRPAHRRVGRRPPRLRAPDEGRHAGPRPRPRRARGRPSPSWSSCCRAARRSGSRKRTGDIIELREVLDEVGADAARLTYLLQSIDTPADLRHRRGQERGDGEPGLLRADGPRPDPRRSTRVAAERGVARVPLADVDLVAARPRARARDAAGAVRAARHRARWPRRSGRRTSITTWVRELAGAVHGFYHDCYVMGDGVAPELTQARLWLVEAAEIGLAIGLDLLGCQRAGVDVSALRERRRHARLLPDTATVGDRGQLSIGGCDTLDLAAEFGTPLFVYDEAHLRARCREAVAAFGPGVNYATKAFLCSAMARLAVRGGHEPRRVDRRRVPRGPGRRRARRPRWCSTATTSRVDELRAGPGRGRRPHRRRLVRRDRPHRGARGRGPARAHGADPGHARASRPTPTSSSRPARTTPSSASASHTGAAEVAVRAGAGVARRRPGRAPRAHRQPGVRGRASSSWPSRCWPRWFQRPRAARAVGRRRPRRGLRRGRGRPRRITEWANVGPATRWPTPASRRRCTAEPGRAIVAQAGGHALHGRHDQGPPRHPHLRRRSTAA